MRARFSCHETRRLSSLIHAVIFSIVFLILALVFCVLHGENPNGALRGEVQDASAARVPHAQVIVESNTSMTRQATADDRGEFRIDGLLPGSYRVTVTAKGFDQASANVDVAVSLVRDITVMLKPESGRETVNVRSNASSITTESIDTASAVHQAVVSGRHLETLPLAARSFANTADPVPGTEPGEPSAPTKARITAVAPGGSSDLHNELSVDVAANSGD